MSREIKFRAWDRQRMLRFELFNTWCAAFVQNNECSVMQFTGLTDKNRKEMYEGDIVKSHNETQRVEWRQAMSLVSDAIGFIFKNVNDLEVIGNIYENPELVKVE